jgi:lantibiotic modifying enzyme
MKWNYYQAENGLLHPNVYNMGLSHGIPAILSFLSKVHNAGILIDKTKDMIEKIVNFIIENKTDSILYSFSEILDINTPNETVSRLAWCYGDLGVCCSLWQASDVLNSVELKEEIISILTIASGRKSKESTQIYDASLCHGTVGAAHIFQRFYDWTKIPLFKETADYWYEETLKMAHFEDGYAGYKVYTPIEYGGERPSRSFLEGISGIGLVLLYKISGKNPSWEELLFIS